MGDIISIDKIDLNDESAETGKKVRSIADLPHARFMLVTLKNYDILSKHRSAEPISVLCLSGSGYFKAGAETERVEKLTAGTLINLGAGIDHEVGADPEVNLLVTKFKNF